MSATVWVQERREPYSRFVRLSTGIDAPLHDPATPGVNPVSWGAPCPGAGPASTATAPHLSDRFNNPLPPGIDDPPLHLDHPILASFGATRWCPKVIAGA